MRYHVERIFREEGVAVARVTVAAYDTATAEEAREQYLRENFFEAESPPSDDDLPVTALVD